MATRAEGETRADVARRQREQATESPTPHDEPDWGWDEDDPDRTGGDLP
jgi:hypothetical protein